jgi:hypothetical protein
MTDKPNYRRAKRVPKGKRIHTRRTKQATRKARETAPPTNRARS